MPDTSFLPQREANALAILTPLAHAFTAGQPLLLSLRRIQEECAGTPERKVVTDLANDVEAGSILSDAMAKHPQMFGPSVITFVKAGEATGVLDHTLRLIVECGWKFPGRFLFPVDAPK
jgi:type II secretory pathway component PulF